MVHRQIKSSTLIWLILTPILLGIIIFLSIFILSQQKGQDAEPQIEQEITAEQSQNPTFINLQPIVDKWTASAPEKSGIVIYDLDNQQIAATHNADQLFSMESLYKLFIVYEGYLEVENGELDQNMVFADGTTVSECLDITIRESDSKCATNLYNVINKSELFNFLNREGFLQTSLSDLQSTPNEILKIMQKYYYHDGLSDETWAKIQDSMLNQPPTDNGLCDGLCNWRQGLPSGFSIATVYNKVGWKYNDVDNAWSTYNDAAIVEFPATEVTPARKYIIVIMTSETSPNSIVQFGADIERAVLL